MVRHGRLSTTLNVCNDPDEVPACVACALINLMNEYWATTDTNTPQPIQNPGPILNRIENIALMLGAAELDQFDRRYIARRRRQGITQSDANDFYDMLLQQLEVSSANETWQAQCRALYTLTTSERTQCIEPSAGGAPCHHESRLAPRDEFGIVLNINPDDDDMDSIQDLIDAYFTREVAQYFCNECATRGNHYFYTQIEAAPRILKVRLMIFTHEQDEDGDWVQGKINHELESPNPLDLKQYQKHDFFPLRYKLSGVVAHEGTLETGHYIATVKG